MGRHKGIAGRRRLPLDRSAALGAKGRAGGEGGSAVHAVPGWRRSRGGRLGVRWSRPGRGRHCCVRRVRWARSVPRIRRERRFRDPTAFCNDEDQSDNQERHTNAEEREEEDPDDGEDRADDEQQRARGELLRQVRPSGIRTIGTHSRGKNSLQSINATFQGSWEVGERLPDRMLPRRLDMV